MLARIRAFFRWFYRGRSIRLTPEGTRFVLFTLAVGVAAINTGNNLLYLLLAMMLSLIVMSGVLSEQSLKALEIHRRLPTRLFAKEPATGFFSITNRKTRFPTFSLRLQDVVAGAPVDRGVRLLHLAPRASALQAFSLSVPRRGRHRIEEVRLLTRFPFGLFNKTATVPLVSETIVYPEVTPLPVDLALDLAALGADRVRYQRGQGAALYNLRGYHAGDESRLIHWKTSARQGTLIVKETEAEDERRATVALPLDAPDGFTRTPDASTTDEQTFERAVSAAASLVTHFAERGYAVRLVLGDEVIPHGTGEGHRDHLLRALALCEPIRARGIEARSSLVTRLEGGLSGDFSVLVLPWEDAASEQACRSVSLILRM
jgi:uncharacterized protein (DUF58 family)